MKSWKIWIKSSRTFPTCGFYFSIHAHRQSVSNFKSFSNFELWPWPFATSGRIQMSSRSFLSVQERVKVTRSHTFSLFRQLGFTQRCIYPGKPTRPPDGKKRERKRFFTQLFPFPLFVSRWLTAVEYRRVYNSFRPSFYTFDLFKSNFPLHGQVVSVVAWQTKSRSIDSHRNQNFFQLQNHLKWRR